MLIVRNHANIVQFKDIFATNEHVYLVMERLDMNLYAFMKKYQNSLTETEIKLIVAQVSAGLKHCHDNNIMHRDVKPENVLVRLDERHQLVEVKISDFGQGCKINKNTICSYKFGTKGYMAPEVMHGSIRFDQKVDSWALGVLLFNLVTGKMPFKGTEKKIRFDCLNKSVPFTDPAWFECSPELTAIAKGLLQRDSSMRYSMEAVLAQRCLWAQGGSLP